MVRKKNLSETDLEDVSIWEERNHFDNNSKKIQINVIPIKIKCLNEKQKELKKLIEDHEIIISIGPAGCLIKSEKIKIYKLKT